ncbi:Aldose 1-/Glucose-6-phosphate 1-epimerase [Dillenia turbinata]|uniref:Aldose 1-/Glucose-6-phosphate 1-epimerase n=1 Tax=Dillenia turbinata TaxID=194707 RepID=A0AAN8UVQ7_9MAGN
MYGCADPGDDGPPSYGFTVTNKASCEASDCNGKPYQSDPVIQIRPKKARAMWFFARFYSASEAKKRGLINAVVSSCYRVRNINGKPFSFSFAYHSYLLVSDISEVRIEGLETLDYLDNLCHKERFTEQGDAITFESEIDRVYLSTPNVIAVLDHERKRTFVIRKEGLPDVVVWNPWEKKSKAMMDFGDEEYKQMVCVDAAAIEKPITLKPGEEWTGRLEILVVPSSFCSDNLDPSPSLQP